jgi:hypothetical protein
MQSSGLAEMLKVEKGAEDFTPKIDVRNHDVLKVRANHRLVEKRMDA